MKQYNSSLDQFHTAALFAIISKMSKITRLLTTLFLFSIVLSSWLLGSILILRIDSKHLKEFKQFEILGKRNRDLKRSVDTYCRSLDRKAITRQTLASVPVIFKRYDNEEKKREALDAWERARKEKIIRENLIYFPNLNEMWCLVPKAASTSWSKVIIDRLKTEASTTLFDTNSTDALQVILRQNFGNINKTAYVQAVKSDSVQKVLLTRHPFSRIASAYKDKLADRKTKVDGMHFFQRFGSYMNRNRMDKKLIKQKEPTFQEFVDYLIDTKPIDYEDHWKPISLLCGLCHVHYDHIIMTEDLAATNEFHMEHFGIPGQKLPMENINNEKYSSAKLFQSISSAKKVKLLQKYQDDFRLFQYSFLSHYL